MAMLSCPLCCQSCFSSVDRLRASLINVINRPLICPVCSCIAQSLDDLATHLAQHIDVPSQIGHTEVHDVSNVIQNININNETTTAAAAIESKGGVNQFNVVDRNCDGSMTQKLDALLTCDAEPPRIDAQIDQSVRVSYVCNLCDCSFRSHELQQMHMQLVHEIDLRPSNEDSELANAPAISPSMLQCYLCPKRFKMIGSLRLHARMVHGVAHVSQKLCTPNAVVCNQTDNGNLVQTTGNTDEKEMRTGDQISSTSTHVNASSRPIVSNNQCDYFGNYGLGSDVATFAGAEPNDIDGPSNGNNNSKEMIANAEDRVHKCDICSKRFTTKYFLKKHKRLHTGKKIGRQFVWRYHFWWTHFC